MASRSLQIARGKLGLAAAAALSLAVGMAGASGVVGAQQAPAKKTPAAPAQKGAAPAAAAAPAGQSAWVKLCERANAVTKNKEGKDEKKEINICLTHHERLDGNSGMVLVSAALRQVEGQDKLHFMVMVPLGMLIQPGMRAAIYPKDLWEKVQKNEKIDENKVKGIKLGFTLCHPAGCTAEVEATDELINDLKTSGGLVVFAINAGGQPVPFPVPLVGFPEAFAGNPVDNKQYGEARKQLMQQIAQRQQAQYEEYKKKQEEAAKGGGAPATTGATPAPPAAKK